VANNLITEDAPGATIYGPVSGDYELLISSLTFTDLRKAENAFIAVRVVNIDAAGATSECLDSAVSVVAELHRVKIRKEGTIHLEFPIPIKVPFADPGAGRLWCIIAEMQHFPPSASIPRDAEVFVFITGELTTP